MNSKYDDLSLKAAEAIANQLNRKPDSCLGLPSGRSPLGCYQLLCRWSSAGKLDWSKARCFALDDYLDAEETKTFASFLHEHLYKHINLPIAQRYNPRFNDDYDNLIASLGGLDLTMIGIGKNCHVAFNEPGTPRSSWTHCVWLDECTRQQNAAYFGSIEQVPRRAVTMGLHTILQSRQLVLIASGENKREALKKALAEPSTESVPASYVQEHKALTVLTDF